jgi:hypothetical protein
MLALYRAGRQPTRSPPPRGAARRVLIDELGLEPSQVLQRLGRAILLQNPGIKLGPP